MNKKSLLFFCAGFIVAGLIFGALFFFANNKPVHDISAGSAPVAVDSGVIATVDPAAAQESVATGSETPAFRSMLSKTPDANSIQVVINKGDSLYSIAKKNNMTAALLKRINGIDENRLRIGSKIKIPTYRFSLVVDKSQNLLTLKGDEEVLKTYVVSTGQNNSTPVGVFKVTDKLVDPTWYKAGAVLKSQDTGNQLGSRWIGISAKGYGLHGTTEPEKLGRQVTAGCVRLENSDVEELYDLIPAGTQVTIVD